MANLVFNEAALINLLEAPNGPYGDRLLLVAQQITGNYNDAIQGVWQLRSPEALPKAGFEIERGEFGLEAIIGIEDPKVVRSQGGEGSRERKTTSQYMADKFDGLESAKFVDQIMAGWDNQL